MKKSTISEVKKSKSYIKRPKHDQELNSREKNDTVLDKFRTIEPTKF